MNNGFEMRIADVFKFGDGRTVFVGPITGSTNFVHACTCELTVDGAKRGIVQIEGEMITDGRHPDGHRSLSTKEPESLERNTVLSSECWLRPVSQ